MNMAWKILILGFVSVLMAGCSTVGLYYVSEKPLPEGDGIYLLKPDGTYDVDYGFRSGRYPSVNSDEQGILWIKPHSEGPGGPATNQVWYTNISSGGTVLMTHSSGNKRHPRWGQRWYAYQRETPDGDKLVVSSHNNLTEFELSPIVEGGLDFFDNGNKIVYTANDGVYWISAEQTATPQRIAECGSPTSKCRFPVISHDGTLLAYRQTLMLSSGWQESIKIVRIATWQPFKTVMLAPPADLRGVFSFDFSPDDTRLYVTAKATDIADSSGNNNLEIFSIKLDSTDQKRVTNNNIPDYYPSTINFETQSNSQKCESFNAMKIGQRANVGTTLTTPGASFIVEQFQWANGNWTTSGYSEFDNRGYAGGSGVDLRTSNANLRAQHQFPVTQIKFKTGELGGNNNISINGQFKNVGDLVDLNGTTINGVQITVNAVQAGNNWVGEIVLNGTVNSFSIGGQELWIDDYCFITP